MAAAERAKVEARAKAISDSFDQFVGGLSRLSSAASVAWPFESAQQRLPQPEPEAEEAPTAEVHGWRETLLPGLKRRALDLIREMPPMA